MKTSSTHTPNFVTRFSKYVAKKADRVKELGADTATFVKAHPKQTTAAFGAGAVVAFVGVILKNAYERHIQKNMIKTVIGAQNDVEKLHLQEVVVKQRDMLKAMNLRIKSDKECLDANHDTIEAARHEISKLKEKD